jgi:hypothetical protein
MGEPIAGLQAADPQPDDTFAKQWGTLTPSSDCIIAQHVGFQFHLAEPVLDFDSAEMPR